MGAKQFLISLMVIACAAVASAWIGYKTPLAAVPTRPPLAQHQKF